MKTKLIAIILMVSLKGMCGPDGAAQTAVNPMNGDMSGKAALRQQTILNNRYARAEAAQANLNAAEMAELTVLYNKDPWRNIGGATNLARGEGWCEFQGYALQFRDGGVIFNGSYGNVLTVHPAGNPPGVFYGNDLFFVENFPYPARRRVGYDAMMAHFEGFYSYKSPSGQLIQIKKFDYGTPCIKVWSPEEIAANEKKADDQKQAVVDKVLKNNEELADKGDAYGLMRMGERYRDGEGVDKDLAKARVYLKRAADAGEQTAADELSRLSP